MSCAATKFVLTVFQIEYDDTPCDFSQVGRFFCATLATTSKDDRIQTLEKT